MRAVQYDAFGRLPAVRDVPEPAPDDSAAVVRVEATGLCRSDVHGWQGHDPGIRLPHVPGHELVGRVHSVGRRVERFRPGQRVTVPFVCGCGRCPECRSGNAQVCRNQTQPGFTHDGSFAELVLVHAADHNLVVVPDELDAGAAALLGCRFATAYRALAHRAHLQPGETVLVLGCGGVGLSVVLIATALGARVIGVDTDPTAVARARELGAWSGLVSSGLVPDELDEALRAICPDGVPVTVDALGREETLDVALRSLKAGGRHVQVGLLPHDPRVRVSRIISHELTIVGSHGMAARDYPALLDLVASGRLRPQDLIGRRIALDDTPGAMAAMAEGTASPGVTVIDPQA